MRALVVDDSNTMRAFLRRILSPHGFEVLEAKHGLDALNVLARTGSADLALVDWNMPEMNGLEFVTRVRTNPTYAQMQIMMVTSETGLDQLQSAIDAGASEYLMKPFTSVQVENKLSLLGLCSHA